MEMHGLVEMHRYTEMHGYTEMHRYTDEETHGDNKHGRTYKDLAELARMKIGGGDDNGKCD